MSSEVTGTNKTQVSPVLEYESSDLRWALRRATRRWKFPQPQTVWERDRENLATCAFDVRIQDLRLYYSSRWV